VAEATGEGEKRSEKASSGAGFSAFVSHVLDQLSVSAWLPAAMLVGNMAVLVQLHSQKNRNLAEALATLTEKPLGVVIVLVSALVLTTMVTQAFEFELIRFFEGYWGGRWLSSVAALALVARQRRKRDNVVRKRDKMELRAFRSTRLIERKRLPCEKQYIVELIEEDLTGQPSSVGTGWRDRKKRREAATYEWVPQASPELMRRLEAFRSQLGDFPRDHRILPTTLGNTLRTAEDALPLGPGESLESYVLRRWDHVSSALRLEHDQHRIRLDMYCTLVFVFAMLTAVAPALIARGHRYILFTIGVSAGYLLLSFVSYAAAVASARGYGTVLKAFAEVDEPIVMPRHRLLRRSHSQP